MTDRTDVRSPATADLQPPDWRDIRILLHRMRGLLWTADQQNLSAPRSR